jgi:RimJ/RimL family protein N-acetyltransferase
MRNPYIVGKQLYLRHPTEEDVAGKWHEWFSDEEVTRYIGDRYWPNSIEAQREFYLSCLSGRSRLLLSVVDVKTDKHIGVCSLSNISWVHRYGDLAFVIGERGFRKGTYAFECAALMLRVAFLRLNFKTVRGGYAVCNEASAMVLKMLRFETIGTYKEMFWADGRFNDYALCMIRAEDWLAQNGSAGETDRAS